jgi:hypothetical protein
VWCFKGGVTKEFFHLAVHELFDPNYGMFTCHAENTTYWYVRFQLPSIVTVARFESKLGRTLLMGGFCWVACRFNPGSLENEQNFRLVGLVYIYISPLPIAARIP